MRTPGLLLNLMVLSLSLAYGFQFKIRPEHVYAYFSTFSVLFFACLCLAVLYSTRRSGRSDQKRSVPAVSIAEAAVAMAAMLMLSVYLNSKVFGEVWAILLVWVLAAAASALVSRRPISLLLLVLTGTGVQSFIAVVAPMDAAFANMLPVTEAACLNLFKGINPYTAQYPTITSVPLIYLPGILAGYCPAVWAGFDPRVMNIVALIALIGIVWARFSATTSLETLGFLLLPFMFSPVVSQMMTHGHVWLYWILVVLLALCFLWGQVKSTAVVVGAMLLTRQMGVLIAAPFLALGLAIWPWKTVLAAVSVAVGIYLAGMLLLVPFVPDPLRQFYTGLSEIGVRVHLSGGNPFDQVALSSHLIAVGLHDALKWLQVALLAALCIYLYLRQRREGGGARSGSELVVIGASYILIIGLNEFLHRYFYAPGFLLMIVGMLQLQSGRRSASQCPTT